MAKKQVMKPGDNRYDKPFRYSRKHKAYLVTMQHQTKNLPSIIEVTPGHLCRAIPKGRIEKPYGFYEFFSYGYTITWGLVFLRKCQTVDEAIQAVLNFG